jgi:hypothetical protein
VVVTYGATMNRSCIGVCRLDNLTSATPFDTDESTASDSVTLSVEEGWCVIGVAGSAGGSSVTWTGLTEDYDAVDETFYTISNASLSFGTPRRLVDRCFDLTTALPTRSTASSPSPPSPGGRYEKTSRSRSSPATKP